jgi:hypothetical protein
MSRRVPLFEWDEDSQQVAGAHGCGIIAAFLGCLTVFIVLERLGVKSVFMILPSLLLALPIQWALMLLVFPFFVTLMRSLRTSRSNKGQ